MFATTVLPVLALVAARSSETHCYSLSARMFWAGERRSSRESFVCDSSMCVLVMPACKSRRARLFLLMGWSHVASHAISQVSLTEFENLHRELRQVAFKWRRANKLYASAMRRYAH
eukprot:1560964-Pleurochrysis_carterae.AAC.1